VQENYALVAEIYEQLAPFRTRRAGALSGGMKQKLALCCALIHKPSVLFLDEPTTGVDPVSRKEFWEMLKKLREQSITIIVSTPYMDEAAMCDRIALIQQGKILSINTPAQIVENYPDRLFAVKSTGMAKLLRALRQLTWVKNSYASGEYAHVVAVRNTTVNELKNSLENAGLTEIEVMETEPGIEDCFIRLLMKKDG
jgi:ABC-type multidrug transport system ATPase subunit